MKQELETQNLLESATYDTLLRELDGRQFWIRVFIRPCCPRPDSRTAKNKVAAIRNTLSAREDFSSSELDRLYEKLDIGLDWYLGRFCNHETGQKRVLVE